MTGNLVQKGHILTAVIDSYNDETGRGNISLEYVRARNGGGDGHLTLHAEPFTLGERLQFTK